MISTHPFSPGALLRWRCTVCGQHRGGHSAETVPVASVPHTARRPGTSLTTDRADPRLGHGVDDEPTGMNDVYLVLSDEERARGFVRPVRRKYRHETCGAVTTMGQALAETYARQPDFYGATFCVACSMHRPVGADGEFVWIEVDGTTGPKVGT